MACDSRIPNLLALLAWATVFVTGFNAGASEPLSFKLDIQPILTWKGDQNHDDSIHQKL